MANNSSLLYPTAVFYVTCADHGQLDFSLAHAMESKEKADELLNSYIRLLEAAPDESIDSNTIGRRNSKPVRLKSVFLIRKRLYPFSLSYESYSERI